MSTPDKKTIVQPKKAYRSPIIRQYGSVRTITNAVGMTSPNSDGATTGGNRKTA